MKKLNKGKVKKNMKFLKNQKGQGMVEYVLLLVVVIGLVFAFKTPMLKAFNDATGRATSGMDGVLVQ